MGAISQKPLNAEGWEECFITASPHPVLPPLPLCHFIFLLSPRASRFVATCASTASPKLDLRDGAEEGSYDPKEGECQSQM